MAKGRPEIDKEAMFRKIMPSSFSAPSEEEPPRPEPPAPSYSSGVSGGAGPMGTGYPAGGAQPSYVQGPGAVVGGGVQLRKTGSKMLVNIMEYLVIDKLDAAYEKFNNCCKCDKCRQDAAALALNKLKPKYIVVEESQIPLQIAKNNTPEVATSIVQAILQVKAHPQH